MWNQNPSFRFEIDNFSEKETAISSHEFVSGGCEWFLCVHPKGDSSLADDHLSLFLYAANPEPLQTGWKRTAHFYFLVMNQSDKELYKSPMNTNGYELSKARSELSELRNEGFKLDWLMSKFCEVSLDRKKADDDGSRVDQLEERVKNLEQTVSVLKAELNKERSAKSSTSKLSKLLFH